VGKSVQGCSILKSHYGQSSVFGQANTLFKGVLLAFGAHELILEFVNLGLTERAGFKTGLIGNKSTVELKGAVLTMILFTTW
jgi:hypothetical protein